MTLGLKWGKRRWRREGDRRRDAKEWGPAAAAYRRHLARNPADAAIWVQLGHAEKEGGNWDAAVIAYDRAADANPDDPDPFLHIAHLHKNQGRPDPAYEAFRRAYRLDPTTETAAQLGRLKHLAGKQAVQLLGDGTTVFSIQDLFVYLQNHPTMSGIQRVQAGIALHALDDPDLDSYFIINELTPEAGESAFFLIDKTALREIITYASGEWVDHRRLKAMLADAELEAIRVRPGKGSTVILLGAFWGLGNTVDRYLLPKQEGARICAYIYDIIPVTHPEYCDAGLVRDFSMSLAELAQIADFFLTISDHTRHALAELLERNGGRTIPMQTVPLAHSLTATPLGTESWPQSLGRVKGRRYVAYVSTVEGRKNHIYVVNAWRQLIAEGIDVPELVFVGRQGWKIDALMDLLKTTDNLGGRIHIVHGLSDAELNAVYRHAQFTVFTSFVEGWGLPVGESLTHGVPCVASRSSSIPEVGGEFVDYVDPLDLQDGVSVLRRMIVDDAYRAERRVFIAENFRARDWHAVGSDFIAKVKVFEAEATVPGTAWAGLREGHVLRPGDLGLDRVDFRNYLASPTRLLLADNFYTPENHGAWMRGTLGRMTFQTTAVPGTEVIVYASFHPAPGYYDIPISFEVDSGGSRRTTRRWVPLTSMCRLRGHGTVADDGSCSITVEVKAALVSVEGDHRHFAVGMSAIGWVRRDNPALREDLVEAMTFRDMG